MGDFESTNNSLLYLPFYHVYGKVTLMAALMNGETSVAFSRMDPTLFYTSIQEYKVVFYSLRLL